MMNSRNALNLVLLSLALSAMTETPRAAQDQPVDPLSEARALYEAAEFDAALSAIERIDAASVTREQAGERSLYEALCLLALNRKPEAESRIAELIKARPLFQAEESRMPPRLRAIINEVRGRLGPTLVRQYYRSGKQSFDAADYTRAIADFTVVLQLAEDVSARSPGSDLRDITTLAAGFRDLSQKLLASIETTPSPVGAEKSAEKGAEKSAETDTAATIPPVPIWQKLPPYPQTLMRLTFQPVLQGLVDVLVGPDGDVESVKIVKPIHPLYDVLLISTAKQWKYQPATRQGKPVEFLKRIVVEVTVK